MYTHKKRIQGHSQDFSHNCKIKSGSGLQKENTRGVCNGQVAGGNQGKM